MEFQFSLLAGLCVLGTIYIASINGQICSTGMACLNVQACRVPNGMIYCCPTLGQQLYINATNMQCFCSSMNFDHNCYMPGFEWKMGSELLRLTTTARTTPKVTMPNTTCRIDTECYSNYIDICTVDKRRYCCPGGYVTTYRSGMTTTCTCDYSKGTTGSSCTGGSSTLATSASAGIGALLLALIATTRL